MIKICTICKVKKDCNSFIKDKTKPDGYHPHCKKCKMKYYIDNKEKLLLNLKKYYQKHKERILKCRKIFNKNNPEHLRNANLKNNYGITLEQYNKLLKKQNNTCAICSVQKNKLLVDHNHKTGKVRQLLCYACNLLLGLSKENIKILYKSIKYLKKHDN